MSDEMRSGDLRARRLLARDALDRAGTLAFKPVTSAKWVNIDVRRDMSIRVQIEHDTLRGVTPEMMRWWFENLAGGTTWNGVDFSGPTVSHYHLWHHRDHIAVTPLTYGPARNPGFAVGSRGVIDEQFNDYRDRIHAEVITTRLDEEEFTFEIRKWGQMVGSIVHKYPVVRGGSGFGSMQTGKHAVGTRGTTGVNGLQLGTEFAPVMRSPVGIIWRQDDQHAFDVRGKAEGQQRVINQGATSERQILLGQIGAESGAATGGRNNCVIARHGVVLVKGGLYLVNLNCPARSTDQ